MAGLTVKGQAAGSRPAGGYPTSHPTLGGPLRQKPMARSRPLSTRLSTVSRQRRASTARPVLGPLRTQPRTII